MNGQCARRVDACRREDHPFCLQVGLEDVNALGVAADASRKCRCACRVECRTRGLVANADDVNEGVVGAGDGGGADGDLAVGLCDDGELMEGANDGGVEVSATVPFTGVDFVRADAEAERATPPHLEVEVIVPKGEREA